MELGLGVTAPDFNLPDAEGAMHSLREFSDAKALLVMFICNHCPFVIHVADELARVAKDYKERGLAVVAINSNDVENYPDDSPEKMKEFSLAHGFEFPYLFDETQAVAKAYHASCTPDFFLFNGDMELVYRGQLDGARPGNDEPVNGKDLRAAIEKALAGEAVEGEQLPSMGCNIKWKAGNAPSYAG
jgi:peroxiredoxin